ncbi:hypothetical protein [Nostoc sp. PCC 9305]|uniref:hypothetical protein n=1 Tax=Nostoc sp. PCC 9305 TaxID=296636 RepID=UPI0039C705D2
MLVENSVSGVEIKAVYEGEGSAALAPNSEKWSSELIAARSKARTGKLERLKMAGILRENPGFEYLLSSWNDDPALQIVIKKLLAKFPQWGIAIVDGVLVDWEESQ